jgi:hypothetical protein
MLFKGFKGKGLVTRASGTPASSVFRFTNADFSIDQGVNFYTPSYGGSALRRVISPNTANITGRISIILAESTALFFYTIAYSAEELTFDMFYRDGRRRTFSGCKIDNLTFSCKAGEFVQVTIDVICKGWTQDGSSSSGSNSSTSSSSTSSFTVVQKLVDWTKVEILGIFDNDEKASMSYNIKNSLVTIKTNASLNARAVNQGVQEVSGEISIYEATLPVFGSSKYEIYIPTTDVTFRIDDLSVSHLLANHWSFRTPLSPEVVITSLDWTRVDKLKAPTP